ncbi:MAG: hypothetical protein OXG88_09285, partial [Gammaproteobacteria bacterium]|nr:hypothetical protein [Gammaproteobacteria bacterium]
GEVVWISFVILAIVFALWIDSNKRKGREESNFKSLLEECEEQFSSCYAKENCKLLVIRERAEASL